MTQEKEILRVKGEIRETYAKLSKIYAILEQRFEKKLRERGLEYFDIQKGETVLEIWRWRQTPKKIIIEIIRSKQNEGLKTIPLKVIYEQAERIVRKKNFVFKMDNFRNSIRGELNKH